MSDDLTRNEDAYLSEAARFIDQDTAFSHGAGNAAMLVGMCYRDWCAEKTHGDHSLGLTDEKGGPIPHGVKTSEDHAFRQLQHWLEDDVTAVYRVLALFEDAKQARDED